MFNLSIDSDSKEFWNGAKKGKLMIQKCLKSKKFFLYSRAHIKSVAEDNFTWVEASGKGVIYSYTISHIPGGSKYFIDKTPYIVGSILLTEGVRLTSNIIANNMQKVKIGNEVKVQFIKLTNDITFPCFRLIE